MFDIKIKVTMTNPQTIQIFLPDGSSASIREAEITNRLVKAISFPRNKLKELAKREIAQSVGLYFRNRFR